MLKMNNLSDEHFTKNKINEIALNADGSISVAGSINAPSGITLAAQKVNIEPGAKLLNTNTINYSNLVNTVDADGVDVSASLDSNLTLTADENGGIYISARVDNTILDSSISFLDLIGIGVDKEEPFTAAINVGKGAEIISDSDVTLNSTVNVNRTWLNGTSEVSNLLSFDSVLDIAGTIKANNINLESSIVDNFSHNSLARPEASEDQYFAKMFDFFSMFNASKVM